MLEDIREKSQGPAAKMILGLIILTFAVAGVGSYSNAVDTSVADVNGQKISQNAFEKAVKSQRERMAQQFGEMFNTLSADPAYMANFRKGVLDNLINEALIDQSSSYLAVRVSDEQLKNTIRAMPEFQVDGEFDNQRYLALINQAGFYQASSFRDYLRTEMSRRQLSQALIGSEFNLPYQEKITSLLQNQQRNIRFATISAEQFKATTEITAEEINEYYLANQTRFEEQEQVKVDYILLDVAEIAKDINVSDEDLKTAYNENIANYTEEEQRRVSHILVEFGDDVISAKTKAVETLARITKGEDFAVVAKSDSSDTFSAENGGDLEWIERGTMGDAFDDSAFNLVNVGDVSDVIKSDFGFHIIKLTALKAEKTQSFEDVREKLLAKLSEEQAQDEFFALQQTMAQLSFELPDSLDDAAEAVNVKVQTSTWLSRAGNTLPFNNAQVLESVFSDVVLTDNSNSDVVEVNDNLAIVVRLNEYKAAKVKPLAEVEATIKKTLISEKSSEQAATTATELLASFKAGINIDTQLLALTASFVVKENIARTGSGIDNNIVREAFVLPHPAEGTVSASTLTLVNGDLVIVEVQDVVQGSASVNPELSQQQTSQLAQSAYRSYVESLKVTAEITQKM